MIEEDAGKYRDNIFPGLEVGVVLDKNRKTDKITRGIVKDILTRSSEHPYGIKVRLSDGSVGRVKKIFGEEQVITQIGNGHKSAELTDEDLQRLIHAEESKILEFKSSLKWDYHRKQANKDLAEKVVKEIVAFLNSKEPKKWLLIGIQDDHEILGIEKDLETWCRNSRDIFEQTIGNLICEYIGAEFSDYIKIYYKKIKDKNICILEIGFAQHQPAFFKGTKGHEFWLRVNNTIKNLDSKEATAYIKKTWV